MVARQLPAHRGRAAAPPFKARLCSAIVTSVRAAFERASPTKWNPSAAGRTAPPYVKHHTSNSRTAHATEYAAMAPHTPTLTTPRLILRPLELADADAIQAVFPQWEIVKFLTAKVPWPYPPGEALAFTRDVALPAIRAGREWQWSIRRKAAPEQLIGIMHLMDNDGDNRGFWLDPKWQRQGLMTEACEAATAFWFDVLGKPVLRVPKAAANVASVRISQRTGMRLVGTAERDYVCGRLPAEIWELTAEEWRQRNSTERR
jgi:RimJ/RimL family protein N-acetyltransferase